jgi:hypothetical protein
MADRIRAAFLERQLLESEGLNAASDIVQITPVAGAPPDRYIIELRCRGLVRAADGGIQTADRFAVSMHFSDDYLRSVPNPFQVLSVLHPAGAFQPNIAEHAPFVCPGRLPPGMGIVELTYQLWSLWTYRSFNLVDGLNPDACRYARAHQSEFPLDPRPLKRIPAAFTVEPVDAALLRPAGETQREPIA